MATNINTLLCNKQVLGTGLVDCVIRKDKITSILKTKPGWTFDPATETFNAAYVISKIQDGTFAPFMNTLDFTNNTPESNVKEYGDHSKAVVNNGKPEFRYEFDNGIYWHAAAASYSGFRNGGVIEIDRQGTVWVKRNVAGTLLSAYDTNYFNVPTFTPVVGDETAKTFIEYQIRNEVAWTEQMTAITKAEIGADLNDEIAGFIGVSITGTATAGDPILVQVKALSNIGFGIEGLTAANFRIRNAATNAVLAITSVAAGATPGAYSITPTVSLVEDVTLIVETYDDDADVATALVAPNQLYRGESAVITVAA